jgi:heme-degrading monooxygenase HmoA
MASDGSGVRFLLRVRVAQGREEDFLARYGALARRIEDGVPGHIVHELWQNREEPDRWAIVSCWENIDASRVWEQSSDHKALTMPLRECWTEAERSAYALRIESRRRKERP